MQDQQEKPSYKRLKAADLRFMHRLNVLFAEAFEDSVSYLSRKPGDSWLLSLLSKESIIVLVALEGDRVIGGLVAYQLEKLEQERSEVYIYDLAVDADFRRRGIATELIQRLKPIAREMGAWVIFVQADREDEPAIQLYESLGTREEPLHFDISLEVSGENKKRG